MVTLLPSTATKTITVLAAEVATTLTIVAPASVTEKEYFIVQGQLTRSDTGEAIPNMTIDVRYNGNAFGWALTDMQGVYKVTSAIPEPGTVTLKAVFEGAEGYAASEAQSRISVSVPAPLTAIVPIVLPIAVGIVVSRL
jgi:hypothetical protein